jgi:hypothetical protein
MATLTLKNKLQPDFSGVTRGLLFFHLAVRACTWRTPALLEIMTRISEGRFKVDHNQPAIFLIEKGGEPSVANMNNELLFLITKRFWEDGDPIKKAVLTRMFSPEGF